MFDGLKIESNSDRLIPFSIESGWNEK